MTKDLEGNVNFSAFEMSVAVITVMIAMLALFFTYLSYEETKRANALTELSTVIQMTEPEQVKYLANRNNIN